MSDIVLAPTYPSLEREVGGCVGGGWEMEVNASPQQSAPCLEKQHNDGAPLQGFCNLTQTHAERENAAASTAAVSSAAEWMWRFRAIIHPLLLNGESWTQM